MQAYPAESSRRPGRPVKKTTPYQRAKVPARDRDPVPATLEEWNQEMEQIAVQENRRDELMEDEDVVVAPPKKILRKTKTYEYDAGRDLLDQKMNITFRQGAQLSPVVR